MKETILNIRIDEAQKKKLAKASQESSRTMSDYVRLVIDQAIKNKTKV